MTHRTAEVLSDLPPGTSGPGLLGPERREVALHNASRETTVAAGCKVLAIFGWVKDKDQYMWIITDVED